MDRSRLLGIYLDDHLVLLAAGRALARRMGRRAGDELGDLLRDVGAGLGEDRDEVHAIMAERGLRRSRLKPVLGGLAERGGRLKLNGTLVRRSPLTPLVELEGLGLLLEGVRTFWAALDAAGIAPGSDPAGRAARTARQAGRVEALRLGAAPAALRGDSAG